MHKLIPALLPIAILASSASAQVATIDRGSFTISRNGTVAGHEEFSIRSTPGGNREPNYIAQATVTLSTTHLAPALNTDASGAAIRYQVETKTGAQRTAFLTAQVTQGRWVSREQTERGESANQMFVTDRAIVLDATVFHQYWFLVPRALTNGTLAPSVPVIDPTKRTVTRYSLRDAGQERMVIGDSTLAARHIVLSDSTGLARDLWLDTGNRVLKVSIPSEGLVAVRDEPPQ